METDGSASLLSPAWGCEGWQEEEVRQLPPSPSSREDLTLAVHSTFSTIPCLWILESLSTFSPPLPTSHTPPSFFFPFLSELSLP